MLFWWTHHTVVTRSRMSSLLPSDMRSSETLTCSWFSSCTDWRKWSCCCHCLVSCLERTTQRLPSRPSCSEISTCIPSSVCLAVSFCTLHFDCHEHFVLRQYQCGGCSRRLFYKGNVVLSFGYAGGYKHFSRQSPWSRNIATQSVSGGTTVRRLLLLMVTRNLVAIRLKTLSPPIATSTVQVPEEDEEILPPAELFADYFRSARLLIMKLIRHWRRYSVSWG